MEVSGNIKNQVSLESQERLVAIMNDKPTVAKLANTEWKITALKPAVQWMIAEEAIKIKKVESKTFGDVLSCFNGNMASVIRVLTLALLNDRKRIEEEYDSVYNTLLWECNPSEWPTFLFEVLNMLNIEFFFATTGLIQTFREVSLTRKMTMEERELSLREQNGDK